MLPRSCCSRVLHRCLPPLLLALFCFPAAILIFDNDGIRHQPRGIHHEIQQAEPKNFTWDNEDFRRMMESRMAWRRRTLKEACSRFGLDIPGNDSLHRPNPWEFLINKKYHLIWCNVFKAASSSWMYNFNILSGYKPQFLKNNNLVPLQLARKKYPRPTIDELRTALNSSLSFLIVRHPFERLLSAYRDKIQFALPHTHHHKLGNEIILKYRLKMKKGIQNIKEKPQFNPRWPTFQEFISYLIDEQRKGVTLDMHWTPVTEFCTPCQVEFDIIMKFDTLNEDQRYLIELAGIGHIVKPEWKNQSKGPITTEVINKYYRQLSVVQLLQLYNIYRFDFELFGYAIDHFLETVT